MKTLKNHREKMSVCVNIRISKLMCTSIKVGVSIMQHTPIVEPFKCFAIFCFYNETSWLVISFHYNSWFSHFAIQHADFFSNVKVFQWSWMFVIILLILLTFLACMVELISMLDYNSVELGLLIHQLECFLLSALPSMGLDQNLCFC